jgi:hypothetical protein
VGGAEGPEGAEQHLALACAAAAAAAATDDDHDAVPPRRRRRREPKSRTRRACTCAHALSAKVKDEVRRHGGECGRVCRAGAAPCAVDASLYTAAAACADSNAYDNVCVAARAEPAIRARAGRGHGATGRAGWQGRRGRAIGEPGGGGRGPCALSLSRRDDPAADVKQMRLRSWRAGRSARRAGTG